MLSAGILLVLAVSAIVAGVSTVLLLAGRWAAAVKIGRALRMWSAVLVPLVVVHLTMAFGLALAAAVEERRARMDEAIGMLVIDCALVLLVAGVGQVLVKIGRGKQRASDRAGGVDVPAGARCRKHPARRARITCRRCGDFACGPCSVESALCRGCGVESA